MGILEFIAELVKALAWPAVVLCVFLLFRTQLRSAIGRVRMVKQGDTELSFAEEAAETRDLALDAGMTVFYPPKTLKPSLAGLAQTDPKVAVLDAWTDIETAVREVSKSRGIQGTSTVGLVTGLARAGAINDSLAEIVRGLNATRNAAVHDTSPISTDEALNYLMLAKSTETRLRNAAPDPA